MRSSGECPKCHGNRIRIFPSVRAGGGPLSVGEFASDAFTVFSQFDAYTCMTCGYTEFYLKAR